MIIMKSRSTHVLAFHWRKGVDGVTSLTPEELFTIIDNPII